MKKWEALTEVWVALLVQLALDAIQLALDATFIMFLAAVIAKRFDTFAGISWMESVAWAGGVTLVRGLLEKRKT